MSGNSITIVAGIPDYMVGPTAERLSVAELKDVVKNIPPEGEVYMAARIDGKTRLFPVTYVIYDEDGLVMYSGEEQETLLH